MGIVSAVIQGASYIDIVQHFLLVKRSTLSLLAHDTAHVNTKFELRIDPMVERKE